ncbi:MAG: TolC family protein [Blastocatellia bacterium]|jgi:outer membrane protein TolC
MNINLVRGVFLAIYVIFVQSGLASAQEQSREVNPVSDQRVGVDSTKMVRLTLREAILMALESNREIEIERLNVQLTELDYRASQGFYDPALATSLFYDRRNVPIANPLAGGANGGLLTDNLTGTATLSQRIREQGGLLQASYSNDRSTTQNVFNILNPQFTSTLNLSFVQPLLKNRTTDAGRRQIRLARNRLNISDSQFRQRAIEIIAQVQRAYWDLVFARRDREIKRESVELARTQMAHNERLVEVGTLAPSDIISARVELERRNDEAAAAIDAIQRTENALKILLLEPDRSELWQSELIPVELPTVEAGAVLPLADALRLALQNRPELEQFRLRGELNRIDEAFYRNQTRPQVDLFINYGIIGLAGVQRTETNFFAASSALLTSRVNQLSLLAGLPPLPVSDGGGALPPFLIGGSGQGLWNMLKNDFRTWRFGLNINLPLRNRTAEAQLGRALAEGRQIEIQRQRLVQGIEVEVRNALQGVVTARSRVEAARNSRLNAELQYQSEVRKFDAGQSTSFFVLDRQNALSASRGRELRALTDFTKSVAELQRVMSTTLDSNNVEVK